MPEHGSLTGPLDDPLALSPLRRGRLPAVAACLAMALVGGCGDDQATQRKAYEEARAAIEREKATLRNMQLERKRLEGEALLHEFESRVWMGTFVPHKALGLDLGRQLGSDLRLVRFFYRKWPLGWCGRLDRLLARDSQLLPWFDRQQGDAYGRKLKDRYTRLLNDLRDRIAVQNDRVRNAEEYAEIVRPANLAD